MPNTIQHWVHQQADVYLRHGGKIYRRRQIQLLVNALEDIQCHEHGITSAHQLGKAHIHRYYNRHSTLSSKTLYNHYLAFELCWKLLGRVGKPPFPSKMKPLPGASSGVSGPTITPPSFRSVGVSSQQSCGELDP